MTSDWVTTGLSAVVILAAAAVHGIAGFGFAQVSMGIMPLFRSPSSASIIFTATAVVANARVWWSVRDAFDWEKWIVPVGGLVVGMPLGIVVFSGFDAAQMRVAIGAVLVLVSGHRRRRDPATRCRHGLDRGEGLPTGKIIGATAGLLAGILGGAVAVPGPPMIVYGAFMSASGFWTRPGDEGHVHCASSGRSCCTDSEDRQGDEGRDDAAADRGTPSPCRWCSSVRGSV